MYGNILVIAGSDSGGGAGIQADIKTINNFSCFATTVITAVTAQNSSSILEIYPLPLRIIESQIRAIVSDFKISIIKIGMIYNAEIMELVSGLLKKLLPEVRIIFDPVMVSSVGDDLLSNEQEFLKFIREKFMSELYLITPNFNESEAISGIKINDVSDMKLAASTMREYGANSIFLKGGDSHFAEITEMLLTKEKSKIYCNPRIKTLATHGSGCAFASSVACLLLQKKSLERSISGAREYVYQAIKSAIKPGFGHGTLNHNLF